MMFLILENVASPPQTLLDKIDRSLRPKKAELGYQTKRICHNWYGRSFNAGVNARIPFIDFENWVKENITFHILDAGINYVTYDDPDNLPISTGAHTDGTREFVLLWNVEAGGDDAELTFWKEKDRPLYRAPKTPGTDFSKLEFLNKTKLPENKWLLVDARILHSVENLTSTRISLQISFLNKLALQTISNIDDLSKIASI